MKKVNNTNNKYKNNTIYSLNYKFDSISMAGKFSGTALDLIKKYNELAKEAHSNGNYVEMEVFRQYAEHYRKIVTEINDRKNQARDNSNKMDNVDDKQNDKVCTDNNEQSVNMEENNSDNTETAVVANNNLVETEAAEQPVVEKKDSKVHEKRKCRQFKVVEIKEEQQKVSTENEPVQEEVKKTRRVVHHRKAVKTETKGEDIGQSQEI